jgi:hypothetical protein
MNLFITTLRGLRSHAIILIPLTKEFSLFYILPFYFLNFFFIQGLRLKVNILTFNLIPTKVAEPNKNVRGSQYLILYIKNRMWKGDFKKVKGSPFFNKNMGIGI